MVNYSQISLYTICPDQAARTRLLVVVASTPANVSRRNAIRPTWGTVALRTDVVLVFLVGRTTERVQARLMREHAEHGDIVQGNFVDSYRNLTLKTTCMLEWVSRFCSRASLVLKVDEDVFLHIPNLLSFLEEHKRANRTIFGRLTHNWQPFRDQKSKYYVSRSEFPDSVYPDYVTGPAYLLTGDLAARTRLLVVVASTPANVSRRNVIRATWGTVALRTDVVLVFLVGRTTERVQARLMREHAEHGDIVQGNFVDSYRNLTLKTTCMLEWVSRFCSRASLVLKVDEDVFLHIPNLLSFLEEHKRANRTIFGKLAHNWRPFRDQKSKYYVSRSEFPGSVYPDFMTGPAYLLTGDLAPLLYREVLVTRFLFIEGRTDYWRGGQKSRSASRVGKTISQHSQGGQVFCSASYICSHCYTCGTVRVLSHDFIG
ncbi:LOW QUALITY PROTEIN: putative UDP-GlcNAc:betaGal beta-1,3-N-acetylglucosaminyltransferase LOC100288842 [Pollicipes pollicipes]|uniref:LOW QUALITY PROTEIN: putative UDP-GlcNAc:betaGal beta-1,3-N-acetylglucosaminyltransferase LOC100288842 n=1 Tax=Pollicipes pollicipes TaxID=41117 RepID=UPI0018851D7E|nr:LOW QUALITY PROTEIN: putative UDP-GlcNAc:betaGal beta-1,3-N-acetylglucosaminyltransferase LOC100288842 [Pollicipes pollicipes]